MSANQRVRNLGGHYPDRSYLMRGVNGNGSHGSGGISNFITYEHQFIGTCALLSTAATRSAFENLKTSIQLKRVEGMEHALQNFNPDNIYLGVQTNVWKLLLDYGCRRLASNHVDRFIIDNWRLGIPYAFQGALGAALSALITHPVDTLRTIEGEVAYEEGDTNSKIFKRKLSAISLIQDKGLRSVYGGVAMGVGYMLLQEIVCRFLEGMMVSSPSENANLNTSISEILIKFLSLSVAKSVLTPLEVVKKHQQRQAAIDSLLEENSLETLERLYDNEGLGGLYSGWYLSFGEAFTTVVVSHGVYVGCAYLWKRFLGSD